MKNFSQLSFSIALIALVGCAPIPTGPGDKPGAVPPKLISGNKGALWDNPAAFGPVPDYLKSKGDEICRNADYKRAIGYHPNAVGLDGVRLEGGGYFCSN